VENQVSGDGLSRRALRAGAVSALQFGLMQTLRVVNHLILARLLFPEAFGLMAIVNSCMIGLQLFCDLGIQQKIVQSPRGTDPDFLNTAWTLQVGRGVLLWLATLALAWPMAWFYDADALHHLIPVVGLSAVLAGLTSTSRFTLERHLAPGRVIVLELVSQLSSIAVMIVWAKTTASVWALVGGALAYATVMLIGSHTYLPGSSNRFSWRWDCARELFHFGRWMLPATMVLFLLVHGNRLILGKFVTVTELGLFSVALFIGNFVVLLVRAVSSRVLLPLFARASELDTERLTTRMARVRGYILVLTLPPICAIAVWGNEIVSLLYDDRYLGAGWMVQVLALGSILGAINGSAEALVLAHGDSRRHFLSLAGSLVLFVIFLLVGNLLWGWHGIVVAVAATSLARYPFLAWALNRHDGWQPRIDLFALFGAVALLGLLELGKRGLM
jgi:O-antigen/teichoic acid export membrane protein